MSSKCENDKNYNNNNNISNNNNDGEINGYRSCNLYTHTIQTYGVYLGKENVIIYKVINILHKTHLRNTFILYVNEKMENKKQKQRKPKNHLRGI